MVCACVGRPIIDPGRAMTIEDHCPDELAEMACESGQDDQTAGTTHDHSSNTTAGGSSTCTWRIKPDRRCLVSLVDPAHERRRR
jgi:hypothetical protein